MGASTKTVTVAGTVIAAEVGDRGRDADRGSATVAEAPDFKDTGKGPDCRPEIGDGQRTRGGPGDRGPGQDGSGPRGPSSVSKEPLGTQGGQGAARAPYKGPAINEPPKQPAFKEPRLQGSRRTAQGRRSRWGTGGRPPRRTLATARAGRETPALQGASRAAGQAAGTRVQGPAWRPGQNQPAFKGPPQVPRHSRRSTAKARDAGAASATASRAASAAQQRPPPKQRPRQAAGGEAGVKPPKRRRTTRRSPRLERDWISDASAAVSLGTAARLCCARPFAPSIRRACPSPNRAPRRPRRYRCPAEPHAGGRAPRHLACRHRTRASISRGSATAGGVPAASRPRPGGRLHRTTRRRQVDTGQRLHAPHPRRRQEASASSPSIRRARFPAAPSSATASA